MYVDQYERGREGGGMECGVDEGICEGLAGNRVEYGKQVSLKKTVLEIHSL